jgi:hypothetical protein
MTMTGDVDVRRVMPAVCNWGRWVVECATAWCTNAWMPQPGDRMWQCGTCGLDTEIAWPPDPIAIEALLLMRPDPSSRNWRPPETLTDLVMENAAHDIFPPGTDLTCGPEPVVTRLLEQVGDHVVGGLVYGPIESRRLARPAGPSVTRAGEARTYREIGA